MLAEYEAAVEHVVVSAVAPAAGPAVVRAVARVAEPAELKPQPVDEAGTVPGSAEPVSADLVPGSEPAPVLEPVFAPDSGPGLALELGPEFDSELEEEIARPALAERELGDSALGSGLGLVPGSEVDGSESVELPVDSAPVAVAAGSVLSSSVLAVPVLAEPVAVGSAAEPPRDSAAEIVLRPVSDIEPALPGDGDTPEPASRVTVVCSGSS